MNCSPLEQLVGTTLPTKTNTNRLTCGNTFDEETYHNLNTKMPKIDTLDALEEHEEHEDDYQTNSN